MRNYIAPGKNITIVADTDVVSGQGYVVGSIFGVSNNTAPAGSTVVLELEGIYEFAGAGDIGDAAYWNDEDKEVAGDSAEGLFAIGTIVGKSATTVQVRLDGVAISAVPAEAGGGA